MASGSQTLNPSSLSFFPPNCNMGGGPEPVIGVGITTNTTFRPLMKRDSAPRTFSNTFSVDHRSLTSSPAGSIRMTDGSDAVARPISETSSSGSSAHAFVEEEKRLLANSPQTLQNFAEEELLIARGSGALDGEETPGPRAIQQWMKTHPGEGDGTDFATSFSSAFNERFNAVHPPSSSKPLNNVSGHSFGATFKSTSPVSSIGSASVNTPSVDYSTINFDMQLKSSPVIKDLMDRLTRCEYSNKEIHRELSEMHTKVNILVERSLGHMNMSAEPEFRNPFATSASASRSLTPSGGLGPSPLQPAVPQLGNAKTDDLSQLSTRINSLQNSVGQLLALQTQQHLTSLQQGLAPNQGAGLGITQGNGDVPPNQIGPLNTTLHGILGHGLPPNRPDLRPSPRVPNPPMRTWSAGTLELPVRTNDISRQDGPPRDKRRSLANMSRRDSSGILESPSEQWQGSPRDLGPVATKWEHLPLAPELLRSLNRFGVGPPNKIQQRALPFLLKGSDIIAQAPPTQERIAAYVIPAIHVALAHINGKPVPRGPVVVLISTTVDQATQSQRIIRDLGGSIGVRSALGVGATGPNSDLSQELRLLQQNMPHILCGTPQKLHALFTAPGGVSGAEVRLLVLDEVDQLIARNLHEYVFNIVKLLPPPKSRGSNASGPSPSSLTPTQVNASETGLGMSPLAPNNGRRFSAISTAAIEQAPTPISGSQMVERQTALFSNTVPQDVLNLANTIQLRDPVRVLVRRDGVVSHFESNQGTKGVRQFYLYLAFTASGVRTDMSAPNAGGGHGIIGSGRGATSTSETQQAREWKLDALIDLLDDLDTTQIIVHVGGIAALDAVAFKLASKGLEVVPLHNDMNASAKMSSLSRFRGSPSAPTRTQQTRVLVVYDVQLKAPDVAQVPLVINYDLPQAVEEYAHRVSPAISNSHTKAGVVVNFVTAAGGDVEMLRSIECFYKIKCPEVPSSLRDLL